MNGSEESLFPQSKWKRKQKYSLKNYGEEVYSLLKEIMRDENNYQYFQLFPSKIKNIFTTSVYISYIIFENLTQFNMNITKYNNYVNQKFN